MQGSDFVFRGRRYAVQIVNSGERLVCEVSLDGDVVFSKSFIVNEEIEYDGLSNGEKQTDYFMEVTWDDFVKSHEPPLRTLDD